MSSYYYMSCFLILFLFFFQAEDGIRDGHVTGVQTCALPISGAIMVLFVFVLMLLNFRDDDVVDAKLGMHQLVAVLMGIAMLLIIVPAILTTFFAQTGVATETMPQGFGEVAGIGRALTTTFVLPFELAAVLLLTGIVSAMVIAKKRV